ncbi:syntaxin-31 [Impatiens glandulifera]|uniref:syntaxin-31 n=1 Tax=Impatiens glandulifera TaxID=253017 RepID=UPI001FB163E7|nr:syntaxin-31 [Impatiens glandulifera]
MASAGSSVFRDRTSEFRSLLQTLKNIGGISISSNDLHKPQPSATSYLPEFNKKASRIRLAIHEASKKIARLAKLAKKSSIFDDPAREIEELIALIKNDITALNIAISDLHTFQNMEIADGNYSDDGVSHSKTVCDDLKDKLMGATKQFKEVLTARTENIKAHENRKQMFSTSLARENPLKHQIQTAAEPPPWSNQHRTSDSLQPSGSASNGVQSGNQLRRRMASENTPSNEMEMAMLQQTVPRQETYTQSRSVALQNVESTISELSGIFTHLATMVAQQGELAIRIDDNMEESLTNVDNARSALGKHLTQIRSNRGLMIKIFAIIIFFLLLFIFFLA